MSDQRSGSARLPNVTGVKVDLDERTGKNVNTAMVILVILVCSISCALMLMLDPHSLDVGSVYQQF